jgi:hypothetical protein
MIVVIYCAGLVWFASGNSIAAREPCRFWWALALWFVFAPIGWFNSFENRM